MIILVLPLNWAFIESLIFRVNIICKSVIIECIVWYLYRYQQNIYLYHIRTGLCQWSFCHKIFFSSDQGLPIGHLNPTRKYFVINNYLLYFYGLSDASSISFLSKSDYMLFTSLCWGGVTLGLNVPIHYKEILYCG